MDAASPSRFLAIYTRLTVALLSAVVVINGVVDPLWVYHKPWLPQRFVKDQRQGNPGLARFSKYDAVVVGNSLSENFLVSEIESRLGWHALKLSVSGSTAREQRLILEQALRTGQVRNVLWSIDMFSFEYGPDATRFPDFPFHLYDRDATTISKYLLSGSTLLSSIKVVCGDGPKDLEARHVWYHKSTFGKEQVLARWRSDVIHRSNKPDNDDIAWQSVEKQVLDAIRKHPQIRFTFVLPPYTALYRVSELVAPRNQFASRMQFKRKLATSLLQFPNVELFDFETVHEITHDFERYMDLVHFDLQSSNAMLGWIAEGTHRVTLENLDEQIRELEQDTHRYSATVFAADNPFRERLQLEELGLKLPASAALPAGSSNEKPLRTAIRNESSKN
jgi:hypothetical protein